MSLRLFVAADLAAGSLPLGKDQSHYLANVMRARAGDDVLVFNGRHGEWRGRLEAVGKNAVVVAIEAQSRAQAAEPDLWLLAAPIKKDRIDLVAEKAAELGASALWPVFTRRTVMSRVNTERLSAHMVEAA
ncbi:MAG TPA: RsmE family RNA methyltransferase, partial [Magnetospirillum sp.]|nr:RsmE family RNA methyltransferase [Magnetospirillum sp.]